MGDGYISNYNRVAQVSIRIKSRLIMGGWRDELLVCRKIVSIRIKSRLIMGGRRIRSGRHSNLRFNPNQISAYYGGLKDIPQDCRP